jgi:hypothetical protein
MKQVVYFWGVLFGGNANNSANAGFVYANTNNVPSNTNTNISSQLCLKIYKSKDLGSCQKITDCEQGISKSFPKIPFELAKQK